MYTSKKPSKELHAQPVSAQLTRVVGIGGAGGAIAPPIFFEAGKI